LAFEALFGDCNGEKVCGWLGRKKEKKMPLALFSSFLRIKNYSFLENMRKNSTR